MFKAFFKLGGRRWIRTIEAKRNRFTVCPLWPLGNSPLSSFSKIKAYCLNSRLQWSWWTDLNPRPADYKSAALPTELHQLVNLFLVHRRVILYHIENRLSRVFLNFFDFFTLGFISFCCAVTTDNILSQSQTFVNPFSTIF